MYKIRILWGSHLLIDLILCSSEIKVIIRMRIRIRSEKFDDDDDDDDDNNNNNFV
jgi:hypothetical protein